VILIKGPGHPPLLTGHFAEGGNRGIGLDVAIGLAEAGAQVAIVYRSSKSGGEAAATQISEKHRVKALAYQADVVDPTAIEAAIRSVIIDFGHLDIVVANAGICTEIDALDFTPTLFREQMAVNLDGAFYTAQAAAKIFKAQGSGNIIFTTSISAGIVNRPESQAAVSLSLAMSFDNTSSDRSTSIMHQKLALYNWPRALPSSGSIFVGSTALAQATSRPKCWQRHPRSKELHGLLVHLLADLERRMS
jgi:NAD(P)-dependent dehydrogenase (short-subunit alcohol dehydrogenase family)